MGLVDAAAAEYDVPPGMILAVMKGESAFRAGAVSPTGVKGLMQVTGDTYKGLGFTGDRAKPENSIRAGSKLLGQLYKQYGNWEEALAAYNGGPDAVKGLKTGNWGRWAGDAAKQREIRGYAPAIMRNFKEIGGGSAVNKQAADLLATIDKAEQAAAKEANYKIGEEIYQGLVQNFANSELDGEKYLAANLKIMESIPDRDQRAQLMGQIKEDLAFVAFKRDANDQAATTAFLEEAEKQGWTPSRRAAGVDEVENLSRAGKVKLKKQIEDGTVNKRTLANEDATAELMRRIDLPGGTEGAVKTPEALAAYAQEHGLTVNQYAESKAYLDEGGKDGHLNFTRVESLYKKMTDQKEMSNETYDLIVSLFSSGKAREDADVIEGRLRRVIADITLDGEKRGGGAGYGKDGKYYEDREKSVDSWLPDITEEEAAAARQTILELGVISQPELITPEDVRIFHKSDVLGLPLTKLELARVKQLLTGRADKKNTVRIAETGK
jgi:hypothetical protein